MIHVNSTQVICAIGLEFPQPLRSCKSCRDGELFDEHIMIQVVAAYVARMDILTPEVLRVTHAHKAFQDCARALRKTNADDLYAESFISQKVACFWSHSWHGTSWMKMLSLMMRYNGLPSVLVGSCTALVMAGLFSCGLLPGIRRADWLIGQWSTWSIGGGFTATVITFCLWRPQQQVFLDRVCINENDQDQKAASIFSLAGILKRSDEMLILWDATWGERLWCLFELAAFLKSRDAREQRLTIRPTFLGPCSIALFIGICIVVLPLTILPMPASNPLFHVFGSFLFILIPAYFIVAAFRAYFRSVETLKAKLQNLSFDNTRCACCDLGHVQGGIPMMCDRQIVKKCVSIWFGSQEAFEDCVRSAVLQTVVAGLQENIFTRGWSLSVSVPLLWAFLDLVVSHVAGGNISFAIALLIEGLVLWLFCLPLFIDLCRFLMCRYCQRGTSTFREILVNLKVQLMAIACLCLMVGTWIFLCGTRPTTELHERPLGVAVFTGLWGALALLHLCRAPLRLPLRNHFVQSTDPISVGRRGKRRMDLSGRRLAGWTLSELEGCVQIVQGFQATTGT